jgi:CHAT domain
MENLQVPYRAMFMLTVKMKHINWGLLNVNLIESILDAFERLLPRISFSSILRGCIQRSEYEDTSQNPLDELTILGSKIYLLLDPIIREAIEGSDSIRLFTNEMLIPWEIIYNGQEFVSLKHPFGISPTTKRRISIRQRKKNEKLRVMLIIDPQDNLPQARIENEKIISQLKDDVRVDDPIILKGRKEAKWIQVRSYVQEESFDILHVAAHAKFNKKRTKIQE